MRVRELVGYLVSMASLQDEEMARKFADDVFAQMNEADDGEWVKWEDVEMLLKYLDAIDEWRRGE